jgi:hypothetical protein
VNRFAIHIHLFLTSREAELTAYNNLRKLKKAGFTIIVTSPKALPADFYDLIDFFYFDRENQLFKENYEDIKPIVQWFANSIFTLNFVIQKIQPHGLAVLRSMIKGCQVSKMIGFEYIIRFEYDDLFGKESIKKLKEKIDLVINEGYDFYLYKNDYGENKERSDISVHLMFYKCDSFLSVFEKIKNETDYNKALEDFGLPKKAILLEEFIWLSLKDTKYNIWYQGGQSQSLEFSDTHFNSKQIDLSTKGGLFCDVMIIKDSNGYRKNELSVAVSNVSSEEDTDVYFDVYDLNENLISTIKTSIYYLGQMNYNIIDNCDNISFIKIRHNNEDYYKTVKVYKEGDQVKIKDPLIIGYENSSEIFLK